MTFQVYFQIGRDRFSVPEKVNLNKYQYIGEVQAESLDSLFEKMNVIRGDELPVTTFKCRSMSVGDIAVSKDGKYVCDRCGWKTLFDSNFE